jgi:hypothetical protein
MCAGAPRAATTPFEHGDRLSAVMLRSTCIASASG